MAHHEQRERLRAAVPEAAERAFVSGDPCYDRLRASLPMRHRYRRALGADDERTVVALCTTWRPDSLLGSQFGLYEQLLAELDVDRYRVLAIIHPNVSAHHDPETVHRMLAPHVRSGLLLVAPERGWRAAVAAADVLIGDHSSVTAYAAGAGVPVLFGHFPDHAVAPDSAVAALGARAPRLRRDQPLPPQLRKAMTSAAGQHEAHRLITSCPDGAAERVRARCYAMLGLDEPRGEPPVPADPPTGLPTGRLRWRPSALYATGELRPGPDLRVHRLRAEMLSPHQVPSGAHLLTTVTHPGRRLSAAADVLVLDDADDWGPHAEHWLRDALRTRRGLQLAAAVDDTSCTVRTRDGEQVRLTDPTGDSDPALFASAAHRWLAAGFGLAELPDRITVNGAHVAVS
ncbi:CDP-glycerol glycerophosphotransferase family protein [Saccharopolyspora sp. HNM0983]|uniref:CDP-glycerol glycerophosphotransferase family protein n=1 Tax=Saccharopolyspora montiporae TaxID=2781240 RepID=A0A929B7H4_9PSEU|nr:CDP-glycerol glycerophosphotransferase family protein [Saccharopolyspora sp. HNM0983]